MWKFRFEGVKRKAIEMQVSFLAIDIEAMDEALGVVRTSTKKRQKEEAGVETWGSAPLGCRAKGKGKHAEQPWFWNKRSAMP